MCFIEKMTCRGPVNASGTHKYARITDKGYKTEGCLDIKITKHQH